MSGLVVRILARAKSEIKYQVTRCKGKSRSRVPITGQVKVPKSETSVKVRASWEIKLKLRYAKSQNRDQEPDLSQDMPGSKLESDYTRSQNWNQGE